MEVGDVVVMSEAGLDNYGQEYEGKEFVIEKVSTSVEEHPGYDIGMEGMPLYDLRGLDFSLYDYELEEI